MFVDESNVPILAWLHLFHEGSLFQAIACWCSPDPVSAESGVRFCVWAPNAAKVKWSAILMGGTESTWDAAAGTIGIVVSFIPNLGVGAVYKYEIHTSTVKFYWNGSICLLFWIRPNTASIVISGSISLGWWAMAKRKQTTHHQPMLIYEVHFGSWS